MKVKRLLLIAILFWFVTETHAQNIGIKASPNLSNMRYVYSDHKHNHDAKFGLNFGLLAEIKLSEKFDIIGGVEYSQKGFLDHYTRSSQSEAESNVRLHYINIPVKIGYNIKIGSMKLFFEAGLYGGVLFNARFKYSDNDVVLHDVEGDIGKDGNMNRFDIGTSFGTGVSIGRLRTSINYDLGFFDIIYDTEPDLTEDYNFYNRQLSLALAFFIIK